MEAEGLMGEPGTADSASMEEGRTPQYPRKQESRRLREVELKLKKKMRGFGGWQRRVLPRKSSATAAKLADVLMEFTLRALGLCTWLSDNILGLGMVVSTFLAYRFTQFGRHGGPLRPEYSLSIVTALLFFLSGLTHRIDFRRGVLQMKANLLVQAFVFLVTPGLTYGLLSIPAFGRVFSDEVRSGLLLVSCMPPSATTTVILTTAAEGDQGVAIINTAVGNLAGAVVSPLLIHLLLESAAFNLKTSLVRPAVLSLLGRAILVPLVLGQLLQHSLRHVGVVSTPRLSGRDSAGEMKGCAPSVVVSRLSQLLLLLLNYYVFCSCFSHLRGDEYSATTFMVLILFVCGMQVVAMVPCWLLTGYFDVDPPARIAALLCCASKAETLATPLVLTMFDRMKLGMLPIPIVLQITIQAVTGALLVRPLRLWVRAKRSARSSIPALDTDDDWLSLTLQKHGSGVARSALPATRELPSRAVQSPV